MTTLHPHPPGRPARRLGAVVLALAGACAVLAPTIVAAATTTARPTAPATRAKAPAARPKTAAAPKSTARPVDLAAEARELEDRGAYGLALQRLLELREITPRDADLELAIALDEARSGRVEEAWQRLADPLFDQAIADSLPHTRYHEYGPGRWQDWTDGRWKGWHWYVARARAEVAFALGRWDDARASARIAIAARPLSGKDWLVLALAAARGGDLDEAVPAARQALLLDPTVPESHYLNGLFAWRDGRRAEAQEMFRLAVHLDSTWSSPALALVRSRLPMSKPDSLPRRLLHGMREAALITMAARPKIEELHELDAGPRITQPIFAAMPDSLKGLPPVQVAVLVDVDGRIVVNELPWMDPSQVSLASFSRVIGSLAMWRFAPAQRHGVPVATWTGIQIDLPRAHTP